MGRTWKLQLPLGVADPIFMCELAEHLHMPVGELGERMSNHELNVIWPAYFAHKKRKADEEARKERERGRRR
jgi:hypothetical protein